MSAMPGNGQVRILAIRHAPTHSTGLCVGDAEVACALSPEESAREIVARASANNFTCVWSSPRSRCLEPARLVASQLELPLQIDERLREISLGAWQGQTWEHIDATDHARLESWMANWHDESPPDGESISQLSQRVRSWWKELPVGCHLVVAHAGVMRALHVLVHGLSWEESMRASIPHLKGRWFVSTDSGR